MNRSIDFTIKAKSISLILTGAVSQKIYLSFCLQAFPKVWRRYVSLIIPSENIMGRKRSRFPEAL